ncbi:MAG: addiction module protein [Desulfomonilaceae bacterium]|nr:addiction module protein [Desulfomonilaceae bacterium]
MTLRPAEKAELFDKLLSSLYKPDAQIDELWAREAESRLDASEQDKIKAVTLEQVLSKYK